MSPQGLDHQSNGVHFFKVIVESTLQDGEMKLPRSFVKRHWHGISNPVFLRLPNGTKWKVGWTKRNGDVWFRNGWKKFAEYLSLEVSQFMVFKYEENSRFKVIVLGKSALEIKYPLRESGEEVVDMDSSVQIVEDGSPSRARKIKSPSPSSQTCKKMKTNPKDQKAGSSNDLKDRIEALLEKVKKDFRSDKESFTCAIQKTYTERDLLLIPKEFSKPHLNLHNMEGRSATLFTGQETEDRTWDVELRSHIGEQVKFTSGWRKFFMDNNLKIGDVCVFVLHKCRGLLFEVTIFPLGEDTSTPHFEDQEGLSHSPTSSSLRTPETPKADIRLMSKNDFGLCIKRPLHIANIPINYIRKFVSENGKTANLRVGNGSWPVKLLFYDYNSSARFSQGWFEFVKDCNLDVGDSCHFKIVDDKKLEIEVTITRHSRYYID